MKMNRVLKSLLKSAIYIMDETNEQVERVSNRVSQVADETKNVFYPDEDHTLRNAFSFAAGIGLGLGLGVLLAPASGAELRSSISEKIHCVGDTGRDRFSSDSLSGPTGTDAVAV
jgi:gas vesicle protein